MSLRHTLLQLAAKHQLDHHSSAELQSMAGLRGQPAWLPARLPQAVAVAGAALLGLGLIFWVAANWDVLGRFGRIGILQGAIAAGLLAAWLAPAVRAVSSLFAFLLIGALFACIGQTYQTGADPWQLFALWTALGLPLALALRSEVLWMPWILVAALAVELWVEANDGGVGYGESFAVMCAGWILLLALPALMLPPLRRYTGGGAWALRCATLLAMCAIALPGAFMAFSQSPMQLLVPLALTGASAATLKAYDLAALSMASLAFAGLLVVGVARIADAIGLGNTAGMLVTSLFAIAIVSLAASKLLALARAGGKQ